MNKWVPIEILMRNESYDDSHLGISNRYGIYIEIEEGEENHE